MTVMTNDISTVHQIVKSDGDVVTARQLGRKMAGEMGFSRPEQALIATAISELTRNIVNYAGFGEIELGSVQMNGRRGLRFVVLDNGPGIEDLESAMIDGFSTGNSLGLGLPGTRRIVDDFDIQSKPGEGVRVTAVKWL